MRELLGDQDRQEDDNCSAIRLVGFHLDGTLVSPNDILVCIMQIILSKLQSLGLVRLLDELTVCAAVKRPPYGKSALQNGAEADVVASSDQQLL